jgi:hypothetical protein
MTPAKKLLSAIALAAGVIWLQPESLSLAQDKSVLYESRYMLSGFLLRASVVCQGDKRHIDVAFSLLDPDELKAFSKAFPTITEQWMKRGADNFNIGVMKDGIPAACSYALTVLGQAAEIVKGDH